MSLDADARIDRRRLKRRLGVWRVLAVLALVALAVVLLNPYLDFRERGHIARLTVSGIIVQDSDRDRALSQIAEDPQVRALLVRIDSPGGTIVGGETLFKSLRQVAERKPVVATMGTVAASAGYMAALAADRIFAHEGTVTGSIGVLLQTTDITGLLEGIGISTEAIKSAPLKAVPSPLEPLSPAGREAAQIVVADMYEMFVTLVQNRRNLTWEQAVAVSDGRIFTGRQAVSAQLTDAIGGEEEAIQWLATARDVDPVLEVREVVIRRPRDGWLDLVSGLAYRLTGKTLFSERLILDGLISVWHPEAH